MGNVYVNIILKNAGDVTDVRRGYIAETDIRQIPVRALVDPEAGTLIINETIRQFLGLEIHGHHPVALADKTYKTCYSTDAVEIHWENRSTILSAIIFEETEDVLLGAIPLQALDLIIDPVRHQVVGAHGETIVSKV